VNDRELDHLVSGIRDTLAVAAQGHLPAEDDYAELLDRGLTSNEVDVIRRAVNRAVALRAAGDNGLARRETFEAKAQVMTMVRSRTRRTLGPGDDPRSLAALVARP
jgi:hypothetical protein